MNVLYLSYTGLGEPLGASQVLSYLRILANEHRITLITFEKAEDLDDLAIVQELEKACSAVGIRWVRHRYHHRPRFLATTWDLLRFTASAISEARRAPPEIIHARAYIACFVAATVGALLRIPFIFDTRSLWPEEMVTAGRLKRGSLLHRMIVFAERVCFHRAAGVVFLTEAAWRHFQRAVPKVMDREIATIPTCADFSRYHPSHRALGVAPIHVVSVGTLLSGWFRLDMLFACFRAFHELDPNTRFSIFTRDDPERVRRAASSAGFSSKSLIVRALKTGDVPAALRAADCLVMFYAGGQLSELGRSPTRLAEALGTGLPVICNGGVGDVETIIRENRLGVIANHPFEMNGAVVEMLEVLRDPTISLRARATATRLFSVETGAAKYSSLYDRIVSGQPRSRRDRGD